MNKRNLSFGLKLGIFSLLVCGFGRSTQAVKFEMKDLAQRNLILITSDALMEKTLAVSHFASGWVEVTPENLGMLVGEFELDVRTLDTGLELKNIQLRDQLLSSQEFPIAKLSVNAPLSHLKTKLSDGKPLNVKVDGTIKIKNITKTLPLNVKLIYFKESEESHQRLTGNLLKVTGYFDLELAAFGINIPPKYSALIAKTVQVSVDMVGTDRLPNNALSLPEGIKKK